jgi:hypothetical protein
MSFVFSRGRFNRRHRMLPTFILYIKSTFRINKNFPEWLAKIANLIDKTSLGMYYYKRKEENKG